MSELMLRRTRGQLLTVTAILVGIGIVMVYSASALYAYDVQHDAAYFLKRHLCYLALGIVGMLGAMSIRYQRLQRWAKPLLLGSLVLLVAVLVIGSQIGGARRWFRVGSFSFQPSEVAQVTLLLYLADVLSRKQGEIRTFWGGFVPPLVVIGLTALLVLLQPDLGTAVSILASAAGLFVVAKVRWTYLASLGLAAVPALIGLIAMAPYRLRRITAFLDPWADPQGVGYQIVQSFLALGCGGVFGVGLGRSAQKLFYLPGAYADFIFSIIGEELGFIGTTVVLALFAAFLLLGLKIARQTSDLFGKLLATGIVLMISFEAMVNIGVATGALPTKGLPLPLISYGGTSLIMALVAVGLLLNVARSR